MAKFRPSNFNRFSPTFPVCQTHIHFPSFNWDSSRMFCSNIFNVTTFKSYASCCTLSEKFILETIMLILFNFMIFHLQWKYISDTRSLNWCERRCLECCCSKPEVHGEPLSTELALTPACWIRTEIMLRFASFSWRSNELLKYKLKSAIYMFQCFWK